MQRREMRGEAILLGLGLFWAGTVWSGEELPIQVSTSSATRVFVVAWPVADLRAEPKAVNGAAALKRPYAADPLQESQLLFGERVTVFEERGPWVRVEAPEQPEFTHADAWQGYPGWVLREALAPLPEGYAPNAVVVARLASLHADPSRRSPAVDLPMGARVSINFEKDGWARLKRPDGKDGWIRREDVKRLEELPTDAPARRAAILAGARQFLKEPYYWGGRAGHHEKNVETPSGVDCSGLVNVCYRAVGVDVPRDAHEQYMASFPLSSPGDLSPGDLIFLAWTKAPGKVTHVMIYAGGDEVLEAVQEKDVVRQVSLKEKLGSPLHELRPLEPVGERVVYFGRLLSE